jgi:hypothetical protein
MQVGEGVKTVVSWSGVEVNVAITAVDVAITALT